MAFDKKTWENRVSEFPNRRTLTDINSGTEQTVAVTRAEGVITTEGDAFSAANMNSLETRIDEALGGMSIMVLTTAEYENLNVKDSTTLYFLK